MSEKSEDSHSNFPECNVTSSNVFCLTKSPKTKYIQVTVTENREKKQILTFERLKTVKVWHFLAS